MRKKQERLFIIVVSIMVIMILITFLMRNKLKNVISNTFTQLVQGYVLSEYKNYYLTVDYLDSKAMVRENYHEGLLENILVNSANEGYLIMDYTNNKEIEKEKNEYDPNIVALMKNQVYTSMNTQNATQVDIVTKGLIQPSNAIIYPIEKLRDSTFLLNTIYTKTSVALVTQDDINYDKLVSKDMRIIGDNTKPQILIYHTHSQETFTDSIGTDPSTSIVAVGARLKELLVGYGFNVIHCTRQFDVDEAGNLDREHSYQKAKPAIEQLLAENPSIEVVLDIHRDGVDESIHFVTDINGKPTAQLMFFNGVSRHVETGELSYLYNQYRDYNLALSFQMKIKALKYFPTLTRKNYINAYLYNMNLKDKYMLIECGAQTNSLGEVLNAMEPLAALLHDEFTVPWNY